MEQNIQHRARGTAARCVTIAIERILADVEVERRKLDGGESKDRLKYTLEIVFRIAVADLRIQFRQTMQHPALQLRHFGWRDMVLLAEIGQRTQHESQSVAQTAIAVGHTFQNLIADPVVMLVVGRRHPKAQDVRAILLHHLFRCDDIAQRFGHLFALGIERERMCHDGPVGRMAHGAAGLQHRRMKPASVLVGAFQINIRHAVLGPVRAVAQNEGVGRAAVKPDIKDIKNLIVGVMIGVSPQEPRFCALLVPGIRAFGLEGFQHARVDRRIAQQIVRVGRLCVFPDKAGQWHAPCPLPRQHPVRPRLDHRIKAVAPGLRGPGDQFVDRAQRPFTYRGAVAVLPVTDRFVDGGKPLRAVQADHRRFRPPAMRVGDREALAGQERTHFGQLVDHRPVRPAGLAIWLQDAFTAKEWQIRAVRAVVKNVVGHRQAMFDADGIVIITVAGRGVHKAGSGIIGDVFARQQRHVKVPFAVRTLGTTQRVGAGQLRQFIGSYIAQTAIHIAVQTGCSKGIVGQIVGHDQTLADGGPAFLWPPRDLIKAITYRRPKTDRAVLRDRPGRRGPDHDLGAFKPLGACHARELHPDRICLAVVIFYLRLGQGCLFDRRPHHGLGALIKRAVHQEFLELLSDHALGVEIHRQIGVRPVSGNPQTLELITLDIDPAFGKLATFLTEVDDIHLILVAAPGAVLFFDFPFNRQAVAIPARHIAGVPAHHLLRPHNHILEDLVQCMANMQMPVRIRRAIVQGEGLAAFGLVAQAVIDPDLFPTRQPLGLAFG